MQVKLLDEDKFVEIVPFEFDLVYEGQATKGPWNDEPDAFKFSVGDYPCLGLRMRLGHWCGYVGTLNSEEIFAEPWNGFTYDRKSPVLSKMLNLPEDMFHWKGFDCASGQDYIPGFPHISVPREFYKTLEFVVNELYFMVVNKKAVQCRTISHTH